MVLIDWVAISYYWFILSIQYVTLGLMYCKPSKSCTDSNCFSQLHFDLIYVTIQYVSTGEKITLLL